MKKFLFGLVLFASLALIPHLLPFHYQDLLIFLTINVLAVCSYRLVTLTGEWSLIHAVMMGIGGYTAALLFKHFGLSIWFTIPLSGGMVALTAFVLCFPLFRMTQFYFLIGSFAVGEAIRLLWIQFIYPFGGTSGLSGIEPPLVAGIDFMDAVPYYYLALTVVSLSLFILYRIEKSRIGLTLHAVHWKAPLAESVGINTWHYKVLAFVIGSFFVGIAGSLKVHYLGTITPNQFGIGFMVFILIWVIVGGYRKWYGPIIGVVLLTVFDELIRWFEEVRPAIYGLMLILAILFMPKGLESLPEKIQSRLRK